MEMGNAEPQPYQSASQPLIPSAPVTTPSPVTLTATITSESCVERSSFQLVTAPYPVKAYLDCCYNSNVDCTLVVHYYCTEVLDPVTKKKRFETDIRRFPPNVEVNLPRAHHQHLPEALIPIDLDMEEALLTFQNPDVIPVVVEIIPSRSETPQAHISYLCFSQEAGVWKPKLLQQMLYTHERYFILHEFFGVQRHNHPDEESAECVVCMTDRRNTAVLPCRHMCLCTNCANIVRSQPASKCPICRTEVQGLMQVESEAS